MRSFAKLRAGKPLTIGYLGGSITFGVGASDPGTTSWRAQTTQWFRERFPENTVTEINAALNGTGSDLAMFRVGDDLLRSAPDLIFIEFAVNDHRRSAASVVRSCEGLVRRIQRQSSGADIVFVLTTMRSFAEKKGLSPSIHAHRQVARYYQLPEIDAGRVLLDVLADGTESWESLTVDGCHPTDRGHAAYFRAVRDFLEASVDLPPGDHLLLPEPLLPPPVERGRVVAVDRVAPEGWIFEDEPVGRFLRGHLTSECAGSEIRYPFEGTSIGIYWLVAEDSGSLDWSIDDAASGRVDCYDDYAKRFSRPHYRIFSDTLAAGAHELRLRVSPECAPGSKGCVIRIGAFLVNDVDGSSIPHSRIPAESRTRNIG